jgi:uncharacterized protein
MEKEKVLIAGGSGLIGRKLTELLVDKGYEVSHLSRFENQEGPIKKYFWNPKLGIIDKDAFKNIDHLINLAGENIGEKRWNNYRKNEIIESRVNSIKLLFDTIQANNFKIKTIIAASAIGYYGADSYKINTEKSEPGIDFLGKLTQSWEKEINKFAVLPTRLVTLRIGLVLSKNGGALPKMVLPIKLFVGMPSAPGHQMISWIDIHDLCKLFIYALENTNIRGPYNAVSPNAVTNQSFTNTIGRLINRPIWPIKIPKIILKLILGEMQILVTGSSNVKPERLINETNFEFMYPKIEDSMKISLS